MHRRLWLRSTAIALCAASSPPVESNVSAPESAGEEAAPQAQEERPPPKTLVESIEEMPFRFQMVELKRAARGAAQRPQNLEDARTVLNRCIPSDKKALTEWLSEEHVTTALNAATFYEVDIPGQDAIVKWATENVGSFKTPFNLASTGISLQQLFRDDETVTDRIRRDVVPGLREKLPELHGDAFHSAVRLFQRLRIEDEVLWTSVCDEIKNREVTIARKESAAIRLFSCIARHAADNAVTREMFGFLVERVDGMRSYDFSTFLSGAERWGRLTVEDALPLLRRQGERTHHNNARDLGVCFPACVRIAKSLTDSPALDNEAHLSIVQHLRFVFDACETHLSRCMDPAQPDFYWRKPTDIVQALYAYESSNQHPQGLLDDFVSYATAQAPNMSARDVAMTMGILRRAGRLTLEHYTAHAPRIEAAIANDEFTLEEASHVALSHVHVSGSPKLIKALDAYAAKHWKNASKADTAVPFGGHPNACNYTALNFGAAVDSKLFAACDLSVVTVRQLCDVRAAGTQVKTTAKATAELKKRLMSGGVPTSDLVIVARGATKPEDEIRRPAQAAVTAALEAAEWGPFHIQLLAASTKLDRSEYADRAVALGRKLAVSPQQLITVLEVLVPLFPEHSDLKGLVADGSQLLARNSVAYSLRLAKVTQGTPVAVDARWFQAVITGPAARRAKRVKVDELTKLLALAKNSGAVALKPAGSTEDAADGDMERVRKALTYVVEGVVWQADDGRVSRAQVSAFTAVVRSIDPALETSALKEALTKAAPEVSHQVPSVAKSAPSKSGAAPKKAGGKAGTTTEKPKKSELAKPSKPSKAAPAAKAAAAASKAATKAPKLSDKKKAKTPPAKAASKGKKK